MKTIQPAKGYLFCKPDETKTITDSGFYLAKETAPKPKTAIVINVGIDVTAYKRDDVIYYKTYTVTSVDVEGSEYLLIHTDDVIGLQVDVIDDVKIKNNEN